MNEELEKKNEATEPEELPKEPTAAPEEKSNCEEQKGKKTRICREKTRIKEITRAKHEQKIHAAAVCGNRQFGLPEQNPSCGKSKQEMPQ